MGLSDELERLAALRRDGLLSEEEFADAKARLLKDDAPTPDPVDSQAPAAVHQTGSRRSRGTILVGAMVLCLLGVGAYLVIPRDEGDSSSRRPPAPSSTVAVAPNADLQTCKDLDADELDFTLSSSMSDVDRRAAYQAIHSASLGDQAAFVFAVSSVQVDLTRASRTPGISADLKRLIDEAANATGEMDLQAIQSEDAGLYLAALGEVEVTLQNLDRFCRTV